MLGWLIEHKIVPHIPVWDKSKREDGTFSREDFSFDHDANVYVGPGGKTLKTTGKVHDGNTPLYRASKLDCDVRPLKPKCCPKAPARKIPRDVNEAARDYARSPTRTEAYRQSARERKKIERLFDDAKHNLAMVRLGLRDRSGAKNEFLLAATVQNLKRLIKIDAIPPPQPITA